MAPENDQDVGSLRNCGNGGSGERARSASVGFAGRWSQEGNKFSSWHIDREGKENPKKAVHYDSEEIQETETQRDRERERGEVGWTTTCQARK